MRIGPGRYRWEFQLLEGETAEDFDETLDVVRQIGFADDSADNVEAALACGWHAVRYRSPGDLDMSLYFNQQSR